MLSHFLRASVNNTTIPSVNSDPYFNQTTLLLHGDGTNGAQNNTFIDSSSNNFTITRNGTPTQGTFTPFSQNNGYWSNYFPSSSYLTVATNAAFTYGTSDFTMECWVSVNTLGAIQYLIDQRNAGTANAVIPTIYISASNVLTYFVSNAAQITGTTSLSVGVWYHVAVCRSGGNTKMFLNGTQEGSTYTDSNNYAASRVIIASNAATAGNYLTGYVSNVRLINGTALYTSNFTPSTTPLTAVTNTKLLTCQSNTIKDNSSNNFTITTTGTPSVQPLEPFVSTATPYDAATEGGSIYLNGTTDYLTVPNNSNLQFGSGDFTIEFWLYSTSVSANQQIIGTSAQAGTSNNSFLILATSTPELRYFLSSNGTSYDIANSVSFGTLRANQWNHVALVRNGTTFTPYLNGVAGTTTTSSSALFNYTNALSIGRIGVAYTVGYMSNLRIVKGTAVYTSAFTPPTSPLTAITNTQLLLSGTNAGIYDNAIKNDLITVGDAQVSTSVVKYGTGSIKFDGTGDYLSIPNSNLFYIGTGDFTIECWFYIAGNSASTAAGRVASLFSTFVSSGNSFGYYLRINGDSTTTGTGLQFTNSVNAVDYAITYTGTISQSTWHHIAVVRSGTTTTIYFNGTSVASGTLGNQTISNYTYPVRVGSLGYPSFSYDLNGYIDDLRITKGVARYTANFTPPTAAFPNQ